MAQENNVYEFNDRLFERAMENPAYEKEAVEALSDIVVNGADTVQKVSAFKWLASIATEFKVKDTCLSIANKINYSSLELHKPENLEKVRKLSHLINNVMDNYNQFDPKIVEVAFSLGLELGRKVPSYFDNEFKERAIDYLSRPENNGYWSKWSEVQYFEDDTRDCNRDNPEMLFGLYQRIMMLDNVSILEKQLFTNKMSKIAEHKPEYQDIVKSVLVRHFVKRDSDIRDRIFALARLEEQFNFSLERDEDRLLMEIIADKPEEKEFVKELYAHSTVFAVYANDLAPVSQKENALRLLFQDIAKTVCCNPCTVNTDRQVLETLELDSKKVVKLLNFAIR